MSNAFNGDIREQVGFLIKRVQQAFRAKMEASLAVNGLTTSQYAALVHLRETPSLSNAELARRSFVTPPTMIRIVQDLEKLGHLTRTDSVEHKRVINISLTDNGEKILNLCDSKVALIQQQMLLGMSNADIVLFSRFLIQSAEKLESSECE
ncbi:MAG: hypothetical protein A2203_12780 [Chromatiales bacterium RIFOXYA1_FULL_46_5]|nr:MAG: hypothetical protein A2203_12780 [Chromatiales bacterium RIFOXYA1_FULL_46_5]